MNRLKINLLQILLVLCWPLSMAAQAEFEMVTDASTLAAGQQLIVVNTEYNRAIKTTGTSTSRDAYTVTITNGRIIQTASTLQVFTLQGSEGQWQLTDGTNRLYAYSNSSRTLKFGNPSTEADSYAQISIDATGNATIVLSQRFSYNTLRYNRSNTCFTCCKSKTEFYPVQLYRKVDASTGISSPSPALPKGREAHSIYSLDGRQIGLSPLGEMEGALPKGIYIVNGRKMVVR